MSEKYTIKKQKSMGKIESNISEEDKEKKKGMHEGTQKNYYHKCLKIKQKVMT